MGKHLRWACTIMISQIDFCGCSLSCMRLLNLCSTCCSALLCCHFCKAVLAYKLILSCTDCNDLCFSVLLSGL